MNHSTYDVIVLGAGPAGSTAANLLARAGHRVLVLEKETFPRFHVGESLLPADLALFERLGVDLSDPSRFVFKRGALFLDERTGEQVAFSFADGLPGTPTHAYQVERADFDTMLIERAVALGAELRYATRAEAVTIDDDGVWVTANGEPLRARYLVDATGQNAFMAGQLRTRQRIEGLGLAAVGCHFQGLSDAAAAELYETGNVLVFMLEDGWGWGIPLSGNRLSVGRVMAKQGIGEDTLQQLLDGSPTLQRLTAGATRVGGVRVGNYSYKNTAPHGARYACVGDSACFLDPVFSSGVTFAMFGAEKLVEQLDPALRSGAEADPELAAPLATFMQHAYDVFGALCGRFYHADLVHRVFFYDSPDPHITRGVVSVLAGDIYRDDNPFQRMLLGDRRRMRI
ncbi:MAG: NAD(P)/FAD-dependent oxidoreductase [Polyangiales bacterium]